ncbi:MAG: dihydroxyacetone kinase subunit DhaL, partial [Arachnia sp.]
MTETAALSTLTSWLRNFAGVVVENRTYLTDLDSAIGDADHGANMARGMQGVVAMLDAEEPTAVDALFKKVGMTLVSTVGGASGPLYGTFFMKFGVQGGSGASLDASQLGAALRAGMDGVVARGKAALDDKTMIDAMSPALEAWDQALDEG